MTEQSSELYLEKENAPFVSVIIPTFNRKTRLIKLLDSVFRSNYPRDKLEVIVIDDASTDGTYQSLQKNFSEVKIIRNQSEKMLAASRNIGISNARGGYVFLVDDDNILEGNCIMELTNVLNSNPVVGVCGPIAYYLGEPQRVWCAGVKTDMLTSLTEQISKDAVDSGQLQQLIECDCVINAFMIRKQMVEKIGMFDERDFPIHYEESDFGERVRRGGYKIVCNPRAKVWHDVPLPGTVSSNVRLSQTHPQTRAYFAARNRIIFMKKYSSKRQFSAYVLLFNWLITMYYVRGILLSPEKRRTEIAKSYLKGAFAGFIEITKM